MHCTLCYLDGHELPTCPDALRMAAGRSEPEIDPRSDATDVNDALQERCHRLRAALRGALADLRAVGAQPSPATLSLIPAHEVLD